MRYTPTTAHSKLQTAAAKYLEFKVLARKVTVFNTDPATGTWTDITTRITEIPPIRTQLEYNLGQFVTDSIGLKGRDIAFFKALFTLTASEYLEVKITGQIGYGPGNLESTTVILFCGFVDIPSLSYDEEKNLALFTVYALDDFSGRISAEVLSTRYVVQNLFSTTEGLYLPKIPGIYATDANVATYVLALGTHTLDFRYSSPNYQARLDGGTWTNLTANSETTLTNAAGNQKLKVYAKSSLWLQAEATEAIIVKNAGDTLPYTWYAYTWIEDLLKIAFTQVGARGFNFDTFTLNTYDSTRRLSFMGIPPGDPSIEGYRLAICSDNLANNLLYIGVKGNLYQFNVSTRAWSLLATVDSGADTFIFDIQACLPNEGGSYIFVFYNAGGTSSAKRCDLDGGNLTSAVTTGISLHGQSAKVFNYEYDSPDYIYDILAVDDENNRIVKIDVINWTVSSLFTYAALGYTSGYLAGPSMKRGSDKFYFLVREDAAITYGCYLHFIQFTLSGTWAWRNQGSPYEIDGGGSDLAPEQLAAVADNSRDYWYYWDYIDSTLKRLSFTASTETTVASSVTITALYYNPGQAVTYYVLSNGKIYSVATTTPTYLDETVVINNSPLLFTSILAGDNTATYGIDGTGLINGRMFKIGVALEMYAEYGSFDGATLKEAIIELCNGFNLIFKVNPSKQVYVYRRGNATGSIVSTGQTLTGGSSLASALIQEASQYLKIGLVSVSNGVAETNYNGTNFDTTVLSDTRRLTVENRFTPTKLLKDLAYYIYQYYKTTRIPYRVYFDAIPYWQYEPFDLLSFNLAGTKIGITGSGLIVEVEYTSGGATVFKAVI